MPDPLGGGVTTLLRRIAGTFRTAAFEREMAEEFRVHVALETEMLIARGMDAAAARAEAQRRFGSTALAGDACRDSWGLRVLDALNQDVRYAGRTFVKHPGFTLIVIVTLGLGIGATTAIFSAVEAVLLRSLPYAAGDRLVEIRQQVPGRGVANMGLSAREVDDYGAQAASLDGVVEYHQMWFTLLDREEPLRVVTGVVSPTFFDVIGVTPLLGRTFREDDDRHDAAAVLIVSHGFWQRALGGDPDVVGRTFQMNDRMHTVVGVLPPLPQYPAENDVYMPVSACPFRSAPGMAADRRMRMVSAIGRLKSGVPLATANAELAMIGARLASTYPEAYDRDGGFATTALSVRDELTRRARPSLLVLAAAAGFVLLLVCANVANLMTARLAGRGRELALRTALGAGRARLARQLITECVMLACAGGAIGLLLAVITRDLLAAFVARFTLRAAEITIDRNVLLFATGVSMISGLLFGAAARPPASASPRRVYRMKQGLIAAQVAISFVLLIGAGLLLRSFLKLRAVDGGFDAQHVLTAIVDLDWVRYDSPDRRREYFRALVERLRHQSGVEAAALSLTFPLNESEPYNQPIVVDLPRPESPTRPADLRLASPDYFRAVGMSLLRGRAFTVMDREGSRPVAIVNLSMARHFFGGSDPIGGRLSFDNGRTWRRVVGVVNDVKQYGLASDPADEVYLRFAQRAPLSATLVVRTAGDPQTIWTAVQRVARELDPRQPISRPQTLEQVRTASIASPRVLTLLVALFAAVALAITAAGIGGVVSFFVSQRTTEIGVRRTLGASRAALVRMIAAQGLAPVAGGLALGAATALLTTRGVARLLFAVRTTDFTTYAGVIVTVAAVAAFACVVPARRAASIEPTTALRAK